MSPQPQPRQEDEHAAPASFTVVHGLAVLTAILGILMIVGAIAGGGGLGSYGVLVGAFFVAAGVMRLRLLMVRARR
ncbi:MAG: hypothetical protein JHD16_15420 [Solirubrobacteraceae bacterium]|nr:hypothetical protein [Solirubrobacteraceae bacterium]